MAGEAPGRISRFELPARGAAPLNAILAATGLGYSNNIGIYSDGRFSYQLTIYVFLYEGGTAMSILGPDNPIARSRSPGTSRRWPRCAGRSPTAAIGARCLGRRRLGRPDS